ncbi:hypothetical protein [uncultured Gammaproteobacteria bacterium]|jgi:hypothetical protein|nr:hypothetical protein [uncultured Gammaproteobacteria bacterium]CAC9958308.1 hypothetical protein [uncultured Gammaproteobacteria bacterium]
MNDAYSTLLETLNVSDDISPNKLEIISASLINKKDYLESFKLTINHEMEGLRIDLTNQPFRIYKTKKDALMYCDEQSFDRDILIIEDSKIWKFDNSNQTDVFIENIKLWFSYKEILIDKIADYVNQIDNEFILLSTDKGKIDIGFSEKPIEYFDNNFKQKTFKSISKLIDKDNDFISFLKDSFISMCSKELKENRFSYAINNIESLYEEALRDYNLYKNKFSFEKFNKGLEQEERKYLENYQLFLSDFLGKVTNFPIQIGIYLFLIYRFSELTLALLAIVVLIFVWGCYTFQIISIMNSNIREIKENFNASISLIQKKSGLSKPEFNKTKEQITDKSDKLSRLLNSYKHINIVSSVLFIVIALYYLWCGLVL